MWLAFYFFILLLWTDTINGYWRFLHDRHRFKFFWLILHLILLHLPWHYLTNCMLLDFRVLILFLICSKVEQRFLLHHFFLVQSEFKSFSLFRRDYLHFLGIRHRISFNRALLLLLIVPILRLLFFSFRSTWESRAQMRSLWFFVFFLVRYWFLQMSRRFFWRQIVFTATLIQVLRGTIVFVQNFSALDWTFCDNWHASMA